MDTYTFASIKKDAASTLPSDDTIFIGDMAFRNKSFMGGDIQYSMIMDKRKWVFRMMNIVHFKKIRQLFQGERKRRAKIPRFIS
ncbi:MAG: hypothetical protein DI538_26935, partial [Azospira oryzae]